MSEHAGKVPAAPWYQYPWVWFVLCIPLAAVAFGIVMIVSANYQPDDLVEDNYYKEGMGINRRLKMDDAAREQGASVVLTAVTGEGAVFSVSGGGDTLVLSLYHVTDRAQDLSTELRFLSGETYVAASRELAAKLQAPGIWYLEIKDESAGWRLRQRIVAPLSQLEIQAQ